MAELVDAPDLGSGLARGGGSSPLSRTISSGQTENFLFTAWHTSDAVSAGIMREFYQDEGSKFAMNLADLFILNSRGPAGR